MARIDADEIRDVVSRKAVRRGEGTHKAPHDVVTRTTEHRDSAQWQARYTPPHNP